MTDSIKVLFIYGSKPARRFKGVERRWFGGTRGGHVGIQFAPDKVLNFRSTKYPCHIIGSSRRSRFRSEFDIRSVRSSWEIFPPHNYNIDSLQRAVVVIPITLQQRQLLDSIITNYTRKVPYDYGTLGMRCASAAYDVLGQLGIVAKHKHLKWLRILLPRKLRTMLYLKAVENKHNGWAARVYTGYAKRIWEGDRVGKNVLKEITVPVQ